MQSVDVDGIMLAARCGLTTRRDVPPKTQWEDLCKEPGNTWMTDFLEAETSGGEIRVATLQSQDTAALRQVLLEMTQDHARITGIFHAAGLADLHFLSETDSQVLNRELEPKAHGSCALYNALAQIADATNITPDFVFLFSSLASILGGLAMASYAAANRFLDGFARQAWGQLGVRWINTNWDDWDFAYDGQVTSAYDTSLARKLALSPDEGIDLIRRILASVENGQVIVASRPLKPRIREWLDQDHEKPLHAAQAQSSDIPKTRVDGCVLNRPPLETFLSEVAAVLGTESVTESDNFFDLGGDSLLVSALQIRLRQNRQWKPPQLKQIFKSPTLAALFETLNAP